MTCRQIARTSRGWRSNAVELADEYGVSRQTIFDYVHGRRRLRDLLTEEQS